MNVLQTYPRITPFLWYDSNAEEAVEFYLTVFKNSRRLDALQTEGDSRGPGGKVMTVGFELDGQKFTAINGGPMFKFNEAVSSWCVATRRKRLTTIGQSSLKEVRKASAAG